MGRNRLRTTRDEVEDLHAKGLTVRQIAGVLGLTTQAVYKHLKALGLTPSRKNKGVA